MPINVLKQIWPEWSIGKRIGGGAYGTVYEASRNEYGVDNHAAIKIISIPASEAEIDTLRSEGLDMQATKTHFQTIVNDFVNEIRLMVSLEGRPNIVNVKDYKVVEKKGEFGWHIFILMELLTPFAVYTCDHQMTEAEVIKLGCDICTALETCAEEKIIHRDIKPGNILVHKSGDFKLGDFGIARKLENMTGGLSQRYTPKYMAPEVATSMYYDERVDIYSLGIVLYELLNGRCIPFQPNKQINSLADIENAVRRRNSGEALPAPSNASPAMADLILRACAYDPNMRFSTATEMKKALQSVANGTYRISTNKMDRTRGVNKPVESYDNTWSVRKAPAASNPKTARTVNNFGSAQKKKSKLPAVLSIVLVLALLVGAGAFLVKMNVDKQAEIDTIIEEAQVLADAEDFVGAIAKIEDGLDEYSDEDKLQDKLDEYQAFLTNQQITAMIANADSLTSNGDFEGAVEIIEAGLADHPDNSALQGKITEYNAALAAQVKAQTLADAQALADSGDYVSAIALIKNAQETQGNDADLSGALKTYSAAYKTEAIESADGLAANGDYIGALEMIGTASAVVGDDAELSAKATEYENAYVDEVIAEADRLMTEHDFTNAISTINSALKIVPGNTKLIDKQSEINSAKPISLSNISVFNGGWEWNNLEPTDSFGNDYSTACNYVVFSDYYDNILPQKGHCGEVNGYRQIFAEYRTKGEYNTLSMQLAPHTEICQNGKVFIQVYADDTLVYTSPTITRKTDAFVCEVGIAGAEYIKIVVNVYIGPVIDGGDEGAILIADAQLWPN